MTKATAIHKPLTVKTTPIIHYEVAMSVPESHLFEVTLQVTNWQAAVLDLKMPVWTPGSYLVREYAKQIQDFRAQTSDEKKILFSRKLSKNHWQIETESVAEIKVKYRVFANDLTVRTNHLDATHGYFNGAALFFFIPGWEQESITVRIVPPKSDWLVSTALPEIKDKVNSFWAEDFDTLVDSPFEIGTHQVYDFEVLGKPHQLAIWGKGNANPTKIIADTRKIIEAEAKIYGGLPYESYLFLLHLSGSGFGGLEHKNSTSLNYPRFGFRAKDKYDRFMQLVAHEFFHLWNVKRIRPKALEKFDYEGENYTTSLWFCEGTTSYYDLLIPLRAKVYDPDGFLEALSKDLTKYLTTPGRKVQPLSESSFDAWIKLYRRDANSDNSQISYYLKGQMVSLLLDLLIRKRHQNQRSLDDVMKIMWQRFGKDEVGFTPEELLEVLESVAETDLSSFSDRYIDGLDELPFDEYLQPFGLKIKQIEDSEPVPYFGAKVVTKNGKDTIEFVENNSPAAIAGIDADDELLAIARMRVTADRLNERLKDYQAGDKISVTVFHQDELKTYQVKLGKPQPSSYQVVRIKSPSKEQVDLYSGWLKK
ncbi:M61 family metallopeptidase [Oscillatoria salina]|uniref:M61 family metallopeptidase n=1 Tax=Oscillatoria salina TaxID=331517 RepID=UPI0013BE711D|nr:M61 family metallopeptidase [Oscillatoria salina]MBZ8178906.1 M61 family metallopeptidase [Oscillatoria salina IIICB1]NET86668.1 M61 family metallopeptidase [Kamptonema sp. SIO1D9]